MYHGRFLKVSYTICSVQAVKICQWSTCILKQHGGCLIRDRNCLLFASTWFHLQFLYGTLIFLVFCVMLCFCVLFVFLLSLMCTMLPVSLDCLPPESYVPNVASVSGLSSSRVLCAQCCQCLWIVFLLSLMYPMLLVSLDCLPPESYVPNVVSVSGLSSS